MALLGVVIGVLSVILVDSQPHYPISFDQNYVVHLPRQQHPFTIPYYPSPQNVLPSMQAHFVHIDKRLSQLENTIDLLDIQCITQTNEGLINAALQDLAIQVQPDDILINAAGSPGGQQQLQGKFLAPFKIGFIVLLKTMAAKIIAIENKLKNNGGGFTTYCNSVGGQVVDGSCFTYEETPATFAEAIAYCQAKGGHLAVPNINWLNPQFRTDFLTAFPDAATGGSIWVGANVLTPGTVTGLDGSDLTSSFIPSGVAGNVTVTINSAGINFGIDASGGTGTNPYVCQYP